MKNNSGFTLIELMVAMTIFIILVSLSTAIFIQTLRAQREITYITSDNESASEVLEQISRDIRTGYAFTALDASGQQITQVLPDANTPDTAQTLTFTSAQENDTTVSYGLSGNSIVRCLNSSDNCQTPGDYQPITPPGVDIASMSFIPFNLTTGVPRITIVLSVITPTSTQPQVNTYLETTVSARNF